MNIFFFTPVSKKSAIGRMAVLVVSMLHKQGHAVTVIRTESPDLQDKSIFEFGVPVVAWNELEALQRKMIAPELCIYQVGNYYGFHEGCLYWLDKLPGIVCLHDFFLGNLFNDWAATRRSHAQQILEKWYGKHAATDYFEYMANRSFIDLTLDRMPLTEWVCSKAQGVVIHSSWGAPRVLHACPGPVHVVPLCYDAPLTIDAPATEMVDGAPLKLLTIGHVNPNKRIESVIEAIGSDNFLRENISYTVVGSVEKSVAESLSMLASKLGVNLRMTGEVLQTQLASEIQVSDMMSCLRYPVLEAASASAIEAMLCGKAIMCTDIGFYAELPSDLTYKVSLDSEIKDISRHLLFAVNNRDIVRASGYKAQLWAASVFNPANYTKCLLELATDTFKARPVLDATANLHRMTANWHPLGESKLGKDAIWALDIFS